jgi:hypothetical protein
LQIDTLIYYIPIKSKKKDVHVKGKNISDKEKSYKRNPQCRNCPYFINKLVCPFRRKESVKGPQPHHSIARQK